MKIRTFAVTVEVEGSYTMALASLDQQINAFSESCRIVAVERVTLLPRLPNETFRTTLTKTVTYDNSYDENP